ERALRIRSSSSSSSIFGRSTFCNIGAPSASVRAESAFAAWRGACTSRMARAQRSAVFEDSLAERFITGPQQTSVALQTGLGKVPALTLQSRIVPTAALRLYRFPVRRQQLEERR